ncbi:MAG: hypothetical protein V4736_15255, partial [Bdellovibrionota bacterium]
TGSGYTTSYTTGKVIIGNASLGVGGLWSMNRYYGHSQSSANALYNQYRNNAHYWYPDVQDYSATDLTDYDDTFFMNTYAGNTLGKSGSDRAKVASSFYTLAGFRPDVKTKLKGNGLLVPTMEMIFRRARVDSDAEYLSSVAHPSAFGDIDRNLEMAQMAQSITVDNIPPMVQLKVLSENFQSNTSPMFYTQSFTEHVHTTPTSVARVFRRQQPTKTVDVSLDTSFDPNGRALTYEFRVLRGDPGLVTITKLNTSGSQVRITFKPQPVSLIGVDQRTSNLQIVGAFVHNGVFWSAPGFVTVANIRNHTITDTGVSSLYTYGAGHDPNYLNSRGWLTDEFFYDMFGDIKYFIRKAYAPTLEFTGDGLVIVSKDGAGNPLTVSEVFYTADTTSYVTVKSSSKYLDYRMNSEYEQITLPSVSRSGTLKVANPFGAGTVTMIEKGRVGVASFDTRTNEFVYSPTLNFPGKEVVLVRVDNSTTSTSKIYRVTFTITN